MIDWKKIEKVAESRFGVKRFRSGQRNLIGAVIDRRNVIGILPTGAGKSLCYQLPAQLLPGLTLVVSPLISLMQDQVEKLHEKGLDAAALNSFRSDREQRQTVEDIQDGESRLIYVTPERLENPTYLDTFRERGVSLLVVDEAHCVSQWGHDFRPAYLALREAAKRLGNPPVLALTATATADVVEDIIKQLGISNPVVVDEGIDRPNLRFSVQRTVNEEIKRARILEILADEPGIGIIYAATVRTANALAAWLTSQGVAAARYHGQLRPKEREKVQQEFMEDRYKVVVATRAFGLGIDKADVRFVVHYHFPDSIESYYQEAGRAGRDGRPAHAILLYRLEDKRIQSFFLGGKYPTREESWRAYEVLRKLHADRDGKSIAPRELAEASAIKERRLKVITAQLAQAGLISRARRIKLTSDVATSEELARLLDDYELRHRDDREKLRRMMEYAQSTRCRVQSIRSYFGYGEGAACEACDNCRTPANRSAPLPTTLPQSAVA